MLYDVRRFVRLLLTDRDIAVADPRLHGKVDEKGKSKVSQCLRQPIPVVIVDAGTFLAGAQTSEPAYQTSYPEIL